MEESDVVVRENPALEQFTAAIRQIMLALGGWAVGRGYLQGDTLIAIGTVATLLAPFLYGQFKQWNNHTKLVTLANASEKATVK